MAVVVGQVEALFRYPVKSMAGERIEVATLGFSGLAGDRRLAVRRVENRGDFPWLCGSMMPELTCFTPVGAGDGGPPTHVRTPEGTALDLFGPELEAELGRRHGAGVQMMAMKHGVFDEATVSVIATSTVDTLCREARVESDVRRFRPNVLLRATGGAPFVEDSWVGGVLRFGEADDAPAVVVTMKDIRCSMVNIDPGSGRLSPEVLKACVRTNQNNAGVYATVTRGGQLAVGQTVYLQR